MQMLVEESFPKPWFASAGAVVMIRQVKTAVKRISVIHMKPSRRLLCICILVDRDRYSTTTELCSGFQGLGGGACQQAVALCQTSALLASTKMGYIARLPL